MNPGMQEEEKRVEPVEGRKRRQEERQEEASYAAGGWFLRKSLRTVGQVWKRGFLPDRLSLQISSFSTTLLPVTLF